MAAVGVERQLQVDQGVALAAVDPAPVVNLAKELLEEDPELAMSEVAVAALDKPDILELALVAMEELACLTIFRAQPFSTLPAVVLEPLTQGTILAVPEVQASAAMEDQPTKLKLMGLPTLEVAVAVAAI